MIALSEPSAPELEQIRQLYFDSFPPEERRPWESLVAPEDDGPILRTVQHDGVFAGMISYWDFGAFAYVEHFAILPSLRGGGTGAKTLAALKDALVKPIVLEVEPPCEDNPMAARRIGFYHRNGFETLDYDYIQPPYAPGLPSVPLILMSTDPAIDAAQAARTLIQKVYKA